jgi:hypothetical protein
MEGFPQSIDAQPGSKIAVLPNSTENVLLVLKWIDAADCSVKSVARSYAGHAWDGKSTTIIIIITIIITISICHCFIAVFLFFLL